MKEIEPSTPVNESKTPSRYTKTQMGFQGPPIAQSREGSQGEIPYVLPRLEYLEIKMNSWWGCTASIEGVSSHYTSNPRENTIYIEVFYLSHTVPDLVEMQVKNAQEALLNKSNCVSRMGGLGKDKGEHEKSRGTVNKLYFGDNLFLGDSLGQRKVLTDYH